MISAYITDVNHRHSHMETTMQLNEYITGYPIVNTTSGAVMGQTNRHSHSFYSIPYAQPPIDDLRYVIQSYGIIFCCKSLITIKIISVFLPQPTDIVPYQS